MRCLTVDLFNVNYNKNYNINVLEAVSSSVFSEE
jgi:hypothetical protein